MSFGRTGSFIKEKKERKKRQEFHRHKIRVKEEQKLDFASLKEKTILSLDHLGKQKFSEAPGGYGFDNWMKSFNLLLVSFESSAGPSNLPKDYYDKKRDLIARLANPPEESNLDSEIAKLREKEASLREKLQKMGAKLVHVRAGSERAAKLDSLNVDRAILIDKLELERRKFAQRKKDVEDSKRFIKRIFSGRSKGDALASISAKVDELEKKVEVLDQRIVELRGKKDKSGYRILSDEELKQEFPQQFADLSDTASQIDQLLVKRQGERDNSKLREEVTDSIRKLISGIELPSLENGSSEVFSPKSS